MQYVLQCDGRIEKYLADFTALRIASPERCPKCGCRKFYRWGSYKRNVVEENREHRIPVRRMCCANCRKTISFLPDFCVSKAQYSAGFIIHLLSWALGLLGGGAGAQAPGEPDAWENLRRRAYIYRQRFVRKEQLWRLFLHGIKGDIAEIAKKFGSLWREGRLLHEFHDATGVHFMAK